MSRGAARPRRQATEHRAPAARRGPLAPRAGVGARRDGAAATPAAVPAVVPPRWLAALAALAFGLRALAAVQLHDSPLFAEPQLDSFEFLAWARSLAAGEWLDWPATSHGPGYPFLLALLLACSGGSLLGVSLLQGALGATTCLVVAVTAARLAGDVRAGVAAGALLAAHGPLVYVDDALFAEGPFLLLLALALWALVAWRPSLRGAAGAGVLLGLAAATRATALPLLPLVAALVAGGRTPWPRRSAAWMLAGWVAVVAPVVGIVRASSGSWLPVQSFGGLNLYLGNRAGASGTPDARLGGSWDLLFHAPDRHGVVGDAARERWFTSQAAAAVAADPAAFAAGLGRKALWLVQDDEIRDMTEFFRAGTPVLRWLPGFGLLLPLAAWGGWVARRRLPAVVWLFLAALALSNVLIVVSSRYRLPLVPALAILAGAAVAWLLDRGRARRWRELAAAAAALAAVGALAQLREHGPTHTFAEEWTLTARSLQRLGRLDEAQAAVERALAADPGAAAAWLELASVRSRRGDGPGTEEALRQAVARGPDYLQARLALGALLARRGDLAGAATHLRHARWLAPRDGRALGELGPVLLASGQTAAARGVFRQLVAVAPERRVGWLALARLEGAAGRPLAGARLARRAARLAPEDAGAWLLLATLALDGGDLQGAEEALRRTEGLLGAAEPRVAYVRALADRRRGRPEDADRRLRAALRRQPGFRPAAELLLANAAERGRRGEAEAFLAALGAAG